MLIGLVAVLGITVIILAGLVIRMEHKTRRERARQWNGAPEVLKARDRFSAPSVPSGQGVRHAATARADRPRLAVEIIVPRNGEV